MLTKVIDNAYWVGIVVIAVGVLGLVFTLIGKKAINWIPIRIVRKNRMNNKTNNTTPTWMFGLIREQRNRTEKYLYPRLHRLFVSNPSELGIEVDWYNCTIFDFSFTSLSGEMSINKVSLGHQIKLRGTSYCSPCEHCQCTFDIMVDPSVIKLIQDAVSKAGCIECSFLLNWDISPSDMSKPFLKPFVKQWSEQNILTIPR